MRFKGHHIDRISITYKDKGDRLQTDDLFQKVYTYQIFMFNDTVSKIYLDTRLLPFDARTMDLFDTAEGKTH